MQFLAVSRRRTERFSDEEFGAHVESEIDYAVSPTSGTSARVAVRVEM